MTSLKHGIIVFSLLFLLPAASNAQMSISWKWIDKKPLSAPIGGGGAENYKEEWGGYDMTIDISKVNCKLPVSILIMFYREKDVWHPVYKNFPTLVNWDNLEMIPLTIETATNRIANTSSSVNPKDFEDTWALEITRNTKAPFTVFVPSGLWIGDNYGDKPADYFADNLVVRYFPKVEIHDADERFIRQMWKTTPNFSISFDMSAPTFSEVKDLGEEDLSDLLTDCSHDWMFTHQKLQPFEVEVSEGCHREWFYVKTTGVCKLCGTKILLPNQLMESTEAFCKRHNLTEVSKELEGVSANENDEKVVTKYFYKVIRRCTNACCSYDDFIYVTDSVEQRKIPSDVWKCPPHKYLTIKSKVIPYLKKRWTLKEYPEKYDVVIGNDTLTLIRQKGQNDQVYYLASKETMRSFWHTVLGKSDYMQFKAGDNSPVNNISYEECQSFIMKLNEIADEQGIPFMFTLPSKDEWARVAGEVDLKIINNNAWTIRNSGGYIHQTGVFAPFNGFYDLVGNVREYINQESTGADDRVYVIGTHYASEVPQNRETILQLSQMAEEDRDSHVGFRLKAIPEPEIAKMKDKCKYGKMTYFYKVCTECGKHKTIRFKL